MSYIRQYIDFILDIILIFIGCLISSLGVNLFLTHAHLLSGGATGIALMIEYLSDIPSGITVFLINIPLFLLSYKKLSKNFTIYSAIGMISLSISLVITKPFSKLLVLDDILLYCIYGGILCGIGYGLVFTRSASTGGIDIITMIIRQKHSNLNIGSVGLFLNSIILIISAFLFGVPKALYTLISILIQGYFIDNVVKGFSTKKLMLILSEKEEDIINYVIKDLHRGITTIPAKGEFTNQEKKMLYCVVTSRQMIELKEQILAIDPKTFISILDISEVKGRGFTNL